MEAHKPKNRMTNQKLAIFMDDLHATELTKTAMAIRTNGGKR